MNRSFYVVGHRGCRSLYPENTLPSFQKAIELGVDAIEFDVHPTKDGHLVITHDNSLERCSNGKGAVHDYTLEQLKQLDFGSWKGPEHKGIQIPTLEEVLDLITQTAPQNLQILIELKENDNACTEHVLAVIRQYGIIDRTVVLSFLADQLKYLHTLEPSLRLQGFPQNAYSGDASGIYDLTMRVCLFSSIITREQVDFFHNLNTEVDICPVNDAAGLDFATQFDVDTITTDAPDVIMPLLEKRSLRPRPVPAKRLSWRLYGAGMENFGDNDAPLLQDVPEPGDDEILTKVEALGLCFSDIKIIRAGESHPKIWSDDLKKNPLIIGHEAVLSIVKTGKNIPKKYAPGQRFLIQCDVFVKGRSCAYGYGMDGGLTQYSIIDRRVWEGETESYLLDCPDNLPSLSAALLEPWTCVLAAYRITHRTAPKENGTLLLVTEPGNTEIYTLGDRFKGQSAITAVNFSPEAVAFLEKDFGKPIRVLEKLPENEDFDDVVCADLKSVEFGEQTVKLAGYRAVVSFIGDCGNGKWKIDVGALHYKYRFYQGADGKILDAAYAKERRIDLQKNGAAWFPGGAGAMGQMHVELAMLSKNAPKKIFVSDMDNGRIAHLQEKLNDRLKEKGIEFVCCNPSEMSPEEFEKRLNDFAPEGFSDIVVLVPSAKVVDQCCPHLAVGGLLNVFAGIPAGETSAVPVGRIIRDNVRFTGSSGSSTPDMKDALRAAGVHEFEPQSALAAIAGFKAAKKGYEALAAGRFPGKIVVLPDCPDMPLTPFRPEALGEDVAATLDERGGYTMATEQLLKKKWKA